MKWMEIITLRSAKNIRKSLICDLLKQMEQAETAEGLVKIQIYHHATLDTDLSIHLHWKSKLGTQQKSPFGLILCQVLKDYGLLNHSVWIEEEL